MFIMSKHVFYNLSYATITSNKNKKNGQKHFKQLVVNLMTHNINFNKIAFIDWSKMFIMLKHVFNDLLYTITMSNTMKEMIKNVCNN
jgi:hypothetical protein